MVERIIWPAYLDADRSRSEGRRVALDQSIEDPTVDEIAEAIGQVGYDATIERDAIYPREYDPRGRVLAHGVDDATKPDLVQAAAAYVNLLRNSS
ncbi:MAG: signal recognition particle, subunit SRP19 (srp19) [uncultured archaeon A07HR60]|nr:MAG: signal recognition particle, subunit SRP19 (srp19) [uncultured archaeon A07HR60]